MHTTPTRDLPAACCLNHVLAHPSFVLPYLLTCLLVCLLACLLSFSTLFHGGAYCCSRKQNGHFNLQSTVGTHTVAVALSLSLSLATGTPIMCHVKHIHS